jgi:hypothetical protein
MTVVPKLCAWDHHCGGASGVINRIAFKLQRNLLPHLKKVKSTDKSTIPYVTSWMGLIMAMVYNSHQMYQILQSCDHLVDTVQCPTFKAFRLRKAKSKSFFSFCRTAVVSLDLEAEIINLTSDEEEEVTPSPSRKRPENELPNSSGSKFARIGKPKVG